jgi:hypothetical protein
MSNTKIFWGTFLICTGILLLMFQFDWINGGLDFVFNLWPLLIILWGISLLNFQVIIKRIVVASSAILLSLFIVAVFSAGSNTVKKIKFWDNKSDNVSIESIDEQYSLKYLPDIHDTLTIEIDAAAGDFEVADSTDELIFVNAKGIFADVALNYYEKSKEIELDFDTDDDINIRINDKNITREGSVKLNKNVVWNMDIDVGAAAFSADLSQFKIKELRIESAASGVDFKIGEEYEDVKIFVDSGISSVSINIPESFACSIDEDAGLSSLSFAGFKKSDDGLYKTENYNKTKKRIHIEIDGGVSDFKIVRYK